MIVWHSDWTFKAQWFNIQNFQWSLILLYHAMSMLLNVLLLNVTVLYCLYQQCYMFWSFSWTIIRHKKYISKRQIHASWILIICELTSVLCSIKWWMSIFLYISQVKILLSYWLFLKTMLYSKVKIFSFPVVRTFWANVVTLRISFI
jgi:hypothetical protein